MARNEKFGIPRIGDGALSDNELFRKQKFSSGAFHVYWVKSQTQTFTPFSDTGLSFYRSPTEWPKLNHPINVPRTVRFCLPPDGGTSHAAWNSIITAVDSELNSRDSNLNAYSTTSNDLLLTLMPTTSDSTSKNFLGTDVLNIDLWWQSGYGIYWFILPFIPPPLGVSDPTPAYFADIARLQSVFPYFRRYATWIYYDGGFRSFDDVPPTSILRAAIKADLIGNRLPTMVGALVNEGFQFKGEISYETATVSTFLPDLLVYFGLPQ